MDEKPDNKPCNGHDNFMCLYNRLDSYDRMIVDDQLNHCYMEKKKRLYKPEFGKNLKMYMDVYKKDNINISYLAGKMADQIEGKEEIAKKLRQVIKRGTGNYSRSAQVAEILNVSEDILNYGSVCASPNFIYDYLDKADRKLVISTMIQCIQKNMQLN